MLSIFSCWSSVCLLWRNVYLGFLPIFFMGLFVLMILSLTWKWKSLSRARLCNPMDYTAHGILQARILEWVAFPFSRGSSQPRSLTLQADSLPTEPQGKPKNTGVGSLSLLQWIFLTQESNWGLLHCRQILYQLSHQKSPRILERVAYPFSSGSS